MKILSIESSCDETAVSVCEGRVVLSSVIATQVAEHRIYGGVVPEIASRRHTEAISAVCEQALAEAGIGYSDIEAVAVTFAPGLIGALLVGVNFAKGLAMSLGVPLIPVHHLRSHIAANYIDNPDLKPPFLCLLVSGGNTVICEVTDYTKFSIIGQTCDDAAGECFDKTARAMGLSYPGGVMLDNGKMQLQTGKYGISSIIYNGKNLLASEGIRLAVADANGGIHYLKTTSVETLSDGGVFSEIRLHGKFEDMST